MIPNYPRELEQIVMKTLARKREDRWATAGELADALIEFAEAAPPRPAARARWAR